MNVPDVALELRSVSNGSGYSLVITSISYHRQFSDKLNVFYYDQPKAANLVTIEVALVNASGVLVTDKTVPLKVDIDKRNKRAAEPKGKRSFDVKLISGKEINPLKDIRAGTATGTCTMVCQFGRAMNDATIFVTCADPSPEISFGCSIGPFTVSSKNVHAYMYKTTFFSNRQDEPVLVDSTPSFVPTSATQPNLPNEFKKLMGLFEERIAQLRQNNQWQESNHLFLSRFARTGNALLALLETSSDPSREAVDTEEQPAKRLCIPTEPTQLADKITFSESGDIANNQMESTQSNCCDSFGNTAEQFSTQLFGIHSFSYHDGDNKRL